ncbi:MAG TPA: glycine betaine/L-proline ABC transporter ATP-binding protein [Rubrobacteraceae bacterium]|nr:glycine betaine/L-proline ABC transporter ATP-binding protein [Rubrobacteraceae bacterium]
MENCSKVFGRRAQQALEMRRSGKSKAEVERTTGATIGVYDANLDVQQGEIFVTIGLSGSGKSTLLRLINRLIDPTEGEIYLDGDYISKMSTKKLREVRRRKIGMVFQHFGLLPNRTVVDNVTFGLEVQGASSSERKKAGEEALEMVGLHGQGNKMTAELSGGMQQRVGLARALATKQQILLMDEPFSALDPLIKRDMQNLFLEIQGEVQRTVVFVTHDLDEALRLGHRVAIMKDGEIVQLGTPENILREPATEYVERFVEDVDYTKVRTAESVMIRAKEVAYPNEGPTVVLRRMRQAGLSHMFVVDDERRLQGLVEAEEVSRLAERNERELKAAIDTEAPRIKRDTWLREVLPLFVERDDVPVAVCAEDGHLEGVVVRGSLIAGLTTSADHQSEEPTDFSGVGGDGERPEGALLRGSEAGREMDGGR